MKYRSIGNSGDTLSSIGLGCMGMTHAYGTRNDDESVKVLHHALDLGINFWDTADMYGKGSNEELISGVLKENRDKIFIATKFGFRYRDNGSSFKDMSSVYLDGSPDYLKTAVEASLRRLKIETIDLYYAHRLDPKIPVEDVIGAMANLVHEGKIRFIGLSEASVENIRKANAVFPVTALQSEYSLLTRDIENEILPVCRELCITVIPYSPLSRGLITNTINMDDLPEHDFRRTLPRFENKHLENNQKLAKEFSELAAGMNATPAQLALAWVLAQGEDIIPIPGTKKVKYLKENAKAVDLSLSEKDLDVIQILMNRFPDIGPRFASNAPKWASDKKE